jgi:hypothetical protein
MKQEFRRVATGELKRRYATHRHPYLWLYRPLKGRPKFRPPLRGADCELTADDWDLSRSANGNLRQSDLVADAGRAVVFAAKNEKSTSMRYSSCLL